MISILLDQFELGYPMARPGSRDANRSQGGQSDRSESSSTVRSSRLEREKSVTDRSDSQSRSDRSVKVIFFSPE